MCSEFVLLNSKGKAVAKGDLELAKRKGYFINSAVVLIVNSKLEVLLIKKDDKWDSFAFDTIKDVALETQIASSFKEVLDITLNKNMLQNILTEKNKKKIGKSKENKFIHLYITRQGLTSQELENLNKGYETKLMPLKDYINELENKNNEYIKYCKNQDKILKTYLLFQKYIKNIK